MQSAEPSPPGQTIIIDRRERSGAFRRVLWPLFFLGLLLVLLGSLVTREAALPMRLVERYVAGDLTASKVAIVEVSGVILDEEVEHALRQIRQARDDDDVRAVVLRIDSPGGSVSGADQIWRELAILKGKKPVVVSMGSLAASGGYYIAAPADFIYAEPTTLTGSIGVLMEVPHVGGLLEKIGVGFEIIKTGEWKDSPSLFEPMDRQEKQRWQGVIDASYQRFVRIIAQGRNLPLEQVRGLADGSVYTAAEALDRKLIDAQGYLDDAIRKSWNLAKLESSRVVRYARPLSLTDALFSLSGSARQAPLDPDALLRARVPRLLMITR